MKKSTICLMVMMLCVGGAALASGEPYPVSKIPAALLKNAHAVIRVDESRFEVVNTHQTIFTHHYVVTILDAAGDGQADFSEDYSKQRQINSAEAVLYNAEGIQLKKVKKKDFEDLSGVDEGTLMDDNRIKHYNFYYKDYPYTVEFTFEIESNNSLFFPRWMPQDGEDLSVESSSYALICPADYAFRYKAFNYTGSPVEVQSKNTKTTTWSVQNLAAIESEAYAPSWQELTTAVLFGPTSFQMDDYKGNMMTWQDFGKFVYALKQGRDKLPDNVKQAVHHLADGVSDPHEKIARLYEYMQQNTRYISIQLGIGGWQPFDASYVATKGYGDCKALSNYMYSILEEAGIPSYYTVIKAGRSATKITADFPSQQFNHVILCVPLPKDTMWLECTSQTLAAGYLSDFTADRYGLMVDENGGKLVRTPRYGIPDNISVRNIKGVIDQEGTLQLKVNTLYGTEEQDEVHAMIHALSKDKVKEYLHKQLDFATFNVNNFDYKENKSSLPTIDEALDVTVNNYATITGRRLFVAPNIMSRMGHWLNSNDNRLYDVEFRSEFRDVDSAVIEIPAGYEIEAMPADINLSNKYGKYSNQVKFKDDKLYYYRIMEKKSGRFPAGEYKDLTAFYESIYKADHARVVFVKKE